MKLLLNRVMVLNDHYEAQPDFHRWISFEKPAAKCFNWFSWAHEKITQNKNTLWLRNWSGNTMVA